jgi:hypothetical protein
MREVLQKAPADGVEPIDKWQVSNVAGKPGNYYLVYFGKESPGKWRFQLPRQKRDNPKELAGGMKFRADVLDTWNMTVTPIDKMFTIRQPEEDDYVVVDEEESTIDVPEKPWMALRITRVEE